MKSHFSKFKPSLFVAATGMALVAMSSAASAHDQHDGVVYTITNAAAGNAVMVFERNREGNLVAGGQISTGGKGTGSGLGSQGAVILDRSEQWLFVVNAGSNDISVFAADDDGLKLIDKQSSGGMMPVSVTEHHRLVYVLNAASDSISGFWLDRHGKLLSLPGSTRSLGHGVGGAEVKFSPDGEQLVVTEKASGMVVSYAVGEDGLLGTVSTYQSPTPTPYGFDFGRHHEFFVSEANGGAANASSVSSYKIDEELINIVSKSVATQQTAACWVIATGDGRYVYAADAGGGVLSAFAVNHGGRLTPLNSSGVAASTGPGSHPSDMALSRGSHYLYSLNNGNGTIGAFRINLDGSLTVIGSTAGVPTSANGLAAK